MHATATAKAVGPAQALVFDACTFGLSAYVLTGVGRTVAFAKGVSARHQRHGFFVIHGHAGKGFAYVAGRRHWVWVAVGAFGVHINQAHLHGAQRLFEFALAGVALVAQPFGLGAPVNVFFRFPNIRAAPGKPQRFKAHGVQRHIARQHNQISPRELVAVLLLDRPDEPARLVQAHVVWPTVQRRKTLTARACATATIRNPVSACAVPGHANEKRTVMTVVSGPPVLRVGHQGLEVFNDGVEVQCFEFLCVVERFTQRIGERVLGVQDFQVQLIRPPVGVARGPGHCLGLGAGGEWAFGLG